MNGLRLQKLEEISTPSRQNFAALFFDIATQALGVFSPGNGCFLLCSGGATVPDAGRSLAIFHCRKCKAIRSEILVVPKKRQHPLRLYRGGVLYRGRKRITRLLVFLPGPAASWAAAVHPAYLGFPAFPRTAVPLPPPPEKSRS